MALADVQHLRQFALVAVVGFEPFAEGREVNGHVCGSPMLSLIPKSCLSLSKRRNVSRDFFDKNEIFWYSDKPFACVGLTVHEQGTLVVKRRSRMTTDAKHRVRRRIRARLDELGMTGREVAKALDKSDAWISGVLSGAQALSLEDLDAVARTLRMSPSDLTRLDDSELRELRPHELRWLRHYNRWPSQHQERFLRVLDYFAVTTPDQDSATLLDLWRDLALPDRRRLRAYLKSLLEGRPQPSESPDDDLPDQASDTRG